MPAIEHPDPPILSTVGRDTVWYGENLCQYLQKEFLSDSSLGEHIVPYVPCAGGVFDVGSSLRDCKRHIRLVRSALYAYCDCFAVCALFGDCVDMQLAVSAKERGGADPMK